MMLVTPWSAIPESSEAVCRRTEIIDRAIGVADRTVTYLLAPTGYGKTSLLHAWRLAKPEHAASSIYLDAASFGGDTTRLWIELCHSLGSVALDDPAQPLSSDQLAWQIATLCDRVAARVLILDHYPAGQPELDGLVSAIFHRSASGVRLIIASRSAVALPSRGDARPWASSTISARDLALTREEVGARLESRIGSEPNVLIDLCDGWPLACNLVEQLAEDRPALNPLALVDLLTDRESGYAGFITREVLDPLSASDLEILICTSFLDVLDPDLVTAVTGNQGAWRNLDRMRQIGIVQQNPAHSTGAGLRCQSLIRALLFKRFQARGERASKRLHKRAAVHFLRKGQLQTALRHAFASGDANIATQAFLKAGGVASALRGGGTPGVQASLDLMPSACLAHPRVRVAVAAVMIKEGRGDIGMEMLRELSARQRRGEDAPDPLLLRDIKLVEILAVVCGSSSLGSVASKMEYCLKHSPLTEQTAMQGVIYNVRCLEAFQAGQFGEALLCADTAAYFYQAAGAENGLAHVRLHQARIARMKGEPQNALENLRAAQQLMMETAAPDIYGQADADIQLGLLQADQGDFAPAAALCAAALPRIQKSGERRWEPLYEAYLVLDAARSFDKGQDYSGGTLRDGLAFARSHELIDLETMLRLRFLHKALLNGLIEPGAAMADIERITGVSHWMVRFAYTALNALLLAMADQTADALSLIDNLRDEHRGSGMVRCAVDCLLDRVVVLKLAGRMEEAVENLREALSIAEPAGVISAFIERRKFIYPVLAQVQIERRDELRGPVGMSFSSKILGRLFAQEEGRAAPLSARERAIMSDVAAGRSNKEIARKLDVSPETVRFHLKNVYSKLGVNAGRGNRRIVADLARLHFS